VKPKKQYELARLGKFTYDIMNQVEAGGVYNIVVP